MTAFLRRELYEDYLLVADAWEPLRAGLLLLDELPGPVLSRAPWADEDSSAAVTGYTASFPFRLRLAPEDPACAFLARAALWRQVGPDAETYLCRVSPGSGLTRPARRFRVAVTAESFGGPFGEPVTLSGTLMQSGGMVTGLFDTAGRVFTPSSEP